jgi:hypothetical protein
VIYENRGVGESEDPGGPFTTADLADDLAGEGVLHLLAETH